MSLDVDFRFQSAMHRAAFRNLDKSLSLRVIQSADEFEIPIDAVDKTLLRFAVHTVVSVDAEVLQSYGYLPKVPLLPFGVELQRHGRTGSQARQEEFVRGWALIVSKWRGLIRIPDVLT
jgi:hypothetical protein